MQRYVVNEPSASFRPASHLTDDYRTAEAIAELEASGGGSTVDKVAGAVRYLEPGLVPAAAAVWLHNLMLIVR